MYREIEILSFLQGHPNIVSFYEVVQPKDCKDLYLVFQYVESDLEKVIKANLLKDGHIDYIIFKLLKGLHFIHSKQVVHRDIKPSNILIDKFCEIKIADFGLSRTMNKSRLSQLDPKFHDSRSRPSPKSSSPGGKYKADPDCLRLTDYVASRWYRSPEVLLGSLEYGQSMDIWALGCIFGKVA